MNESFAFHGYSMTNQILCVVQGDDIYQVDYASGNKQAIGKVLSAYNELEQTTTEYYDKLVELGVITKPEDLQEAMAEMRKTMTSMAELIQSLSNEVKELREDGPEHSTDNGKQDVPQHEPPRHSPKSSRGNSGNS